MNRRTFIKLAAASGTGLTLGVRSDVEVERPAMSEVAQMREWCMACGSAMVEGICSGIDVVQWDVTLNFDRPCNEDGTPARIMRNVTVEWEDDGTCIIHGERWEKSEEAT